MQSVSRILCPAYVGSDSANSLSTVYIDIYTSSTQNISYSLHVTYFQSFILRLVSMNSFQLFSYNRIYSFIFSSPFYIKIWKKRAVNFEIGFINSSQHIDIRFDTASLKMTSGNVLKLTVHLNKIKYFDIFTKSWTWKFLWKIRISIH